MKKRTFASRLAEKLWRVPLRRARMMLGFRRKSRGEVDEQSEMGKCLRALARSPMFIRYVEIGSATGMGSTLQLMGGILSRKDDSALWSVECVPLMHHVAAKNWRGRDTGGKLRLIHGSVIRADEMMTADEAKAHPLSAQNEETMHFVNRAYPKNRAAVAAAPDALHLLPDCIDVLLLDGGEFSTHAEFVKLRGRAKVLVLDDSHRAIKNYRVREELQSDPEWRMILERPDDRNGWCIFCREALADAVQKILLHSAREVC